MSDVAAAEGHVADIISEISATTQEQRSGIEQVKQAIMPRAEVTRHNGAASQHGHESAGRRRS